MRTAPRRSSASTSAWPYMDDVTLFGDNRGELTKERAASEKGPVELSKLAPIVVKTLTIGGDPADRDQP